MYISFLDHFYGHNCSFFNIYLNKKSDKPDSYAQSASELLPASQEAIASKRASYR